ncbi:hypothetical protein N656DRAFT_331895 [Canariomyces notabilis]|uniref:Uncharacterized protein n=1 Tax=Canariomyces notabilis TaxID=2074819 RepID=A0AAN6QGC4_9PEZI|nr:hypothetical protein N656DRAFT_331895 [Canariomyces arenarius]
MPPTIEQEPTKVLLYPLFIVVVELKVRKDLTAGESLAEHSPRIQMSLAVTG